jgi:hypothetical protein
VVPAVFGVGVVAQLVYTATHPSHTQITHLDHRAIPRFYLVRILGSFLVGDRYIDSTWKSMGLKLELLGLLVVGAVACYGLVAGKGRRMFIVAAVAYSGILTVASLLLRGTGDPIAYGGTVTLGGSRYTFVPILLLTAAFIAIADVPGGRRWLRVLPALFVAGVAVANVEGPTFVPRRLTLDWPHAVADARARCRSADQVEAIHIDDNPDGWVAPISCRRLGRP